ncbi:hypothetical protein FBQ87_07080 [Sphingobacteriales bacterium CHB3]|nr:hypothetical protein [Sphingobacteriales bacterium CHB3]
MERSSAVYSITGRFIEPTSLQQEQEGTLLFWQEFTDAAYWNTLTLSDLTLNRAAFDEDDIDKWEVSLSPNGQQMLYTMRTEQETRTHDLSLYDLQSGTVLEMFNGLWVVGPAVWSPDSRYAAVAAKPLTEPASDTPFDVYLVDATTRQIENFTRDVEADSGLPRWSSAGSALTIVSSGHTRDQFTIWVFSTDGTLRAEYEVQGDVIGPAVWASNDTALIYTVQRNSVTSMIRLDLLTGSTTVLLERPFIGSYAVSHNSDWVAYIEQSLETEGFVMCTHRLSSRQIECHPSLPADYLSTPVWLSS